MTGTDGRPEKAGGAVAPRRRVLVAGAGGFAGGFIVAEALARGCEVWAGVRRSTSRRYLTDSRIRFVELDFDEPATLAPALRATLPDGERWDWIVYNLGATKCVRFADFNRINYEYLRRFTDALREAGLEPGRLLYVSSLSAVGPCDERGGTPIGEEAIPRPDTRYGASKLKAEMWLATAGIPYIVFRATGLYGPRDKDYLLMFKSIARGFDFGVGYRRQLLSFLYVEDLAAAIFDALERSPAGETYHVGEPRTYTQREFRRIAMRHLGRRRCVPLRMPLWTVRAACAVAAFVGNLRLKPSTLNPDKYHILRQRNWSVDTSKARRMFGFAPRVALDEGVERAVRWYRDNGWL